MATKDRLEELKRTVPDGRMSIVSIEPEENLDFHEILYIQEALERLEERTERCEVLFRQEIFSKELHAKLKAVFQQSEDICQEVAQGLKSLRNSLNLHNEKEQTSTEERIKRVHYFGFCQRFRKALETQQILSQKMQDVHKDLIKKCNRIVTKTDLNEEALERLVEQPPTIFIQDYMVQEKETREMLVQIEERHKELLVIEKHLIEIRELFCQMAFLLEEQQESVNRIEYHVVSTADHIISTKMQLRAAENSKKRNLKWKIILFIIAIVLLLIIIWSLFQ